jgi:hypothetical protein
LNRAKPYQLFFYETLAMFFFVYGYTCYNSKFEIDAQAAASILLAISLSGVLCGANLNAAVTLSNCLRK